jgi:hypothetical protein
VGVGEPWFGVHSADTVFVAYQLPHDRFECDKARIQMVPCYFSLVFAFPIKPIPSNVDRNNKNNAWRLTNSSG